MTTRLRYETYVDRVLQKRRAQERPRRTRYVLITIDGKLMRASESLHRQRIGVFYNRLMRVARLGRRNRRWRRTFVGEATAVPTFRGVPLVIYEAFNECKREVAP